MYRIFLLLGSTALFLNASLAFAQYIPKTIEASTPLTLQSALVMALRANTDLSAAGREVQATEGAIIQAGTSPNPFVSAFVEDTRRATRTTIILYNQPIELGGKRAARLRAARKGRELASVDQQATHSELRASVISAFFDVLATQERLQLMQSLDQLAKRVTHSAARRVTAGKVSPVEETKARIAESGVHIELSQAKSELAYARKRLSSLWGNPVPRFTQAEGQLTNVPALPSPEALAAHLENSPNLLRASVEVERRKALTDVERSRQIPDILVTVGGRRPEELGINQAVLGITVPLPLFDRNQGNLEEALRLTDKARDELISTRMRLSDQLAQAYERLSVAHQEIKLLQKDILPRAHSAYTAASKGFELGKFSFLEVLDAQRTLFQAKSQYLRVLAEAHRASADIEGILGEHSTQSKSRSTR